MHAHSVFKGEKFVDTKKRLQARLGVSDKDFAKYRFALIQFSTFKQPSYIEDGMSPHNITHWRLDVWTHAAL